MDASKAVVPARWRKQERRYRTNGEKRRIVEEALSGESSVAEVARRHGINANLLFNWRKLYREGRLDQCRESVVTAGVKPVRAKAERAAVFIPALLPEAATGHIEIELPGEVRLRVHGRVDRDALCEVLAVLSSR